MSFSTTRSSSFGARVAGCSTKPETGISTRPPDCGSPISGYGRLDVADAVRNQLAELFAYHTFTDFATQPTLDLAERIAAISPDPNSKVFFTSGGSDAVDTAAKLVRRYHALTGNPQRSVIIARELGLSRHAHLWHLDRRDRTKPHRIWRPGGRHRVRAARRH